MFSYKIFSTNSKRTKNDQTDYLNLIILKQISSTALFSMQQTNNKMQISKVPTQPEHPSVGLEKTVKLLLPPTGFLN